MRKTLILFTTIFLLIPILIGCKSTESTPNSPPDPKLLAEAEAIKLRITEEGMYSIKLSDIGWNENNINEISITEKGTPVSYEIIEIDEEPAIIFFGEASNSIYTPYQFYILEQNPDNKRLIADTNTQILDGQPIKTITSTVHLEENLIYVPRVDRGDPWHWNKIVAPQSQIVEVSLPGTTDGVGRLRMALWGSTNAPTTPDHHVKVLMNGRELGEVSWDNQVWQDIDLHIPQGVILEGMNTVEILVTGEVDARIDIVNLDWVEIDYPKQAELTQPQEFFQTPASIISLAFPKQTLALYEVSNPAEVTRVAFGESNTENITLSGNPNHRYLAITENRYLIPDEFLPVNHEPDLRGATGAQYLAIGHPDLLAPLESLLVARNDQGLSTLEVPLDAVYDQFNGGTPEPDALQAFLAYAVENWEISPEYILLVGDTSYDFLGYQSPLDSKYLPTFLVPTVFGGETGSDVRIVQLDGDLSPDLAIGRVPARNVEQVKTFVDKTLAYEKESANATWNQTILAVADGQEASFKEDANHFIDQFSSEYETQIIAPEAGAQGTNQEITNEFSKGNLVTAYFGHGSVNMWGKDSLFTTQDSATLNNGQNLPIVWNFTCLTGLFTHPTEESLAESLLFNQDGGAVAVLAPTSPTLPGDQTFLSDALVEALIQKTFPRLGDITLYAWQQVPTQSPGTTDVMQTFLLFGDPALQLPSP